VSTGTNIKEYSSTMTMITASAYPDLALELSTSGKTAVLISGGIDSEVLLRAAVEVLGKTNTFPFMAVSQFQAQHYLEKARAAAIDLKLSLSEITIDALSCREICQNSQDRCYYCKKLIYTSIRKAAEAQGIQTLADGTNMDDIKESRPGLKAADEENIHHPFLKTGMNKAAVRNLGTALGVTDTERPADSCLATRIETGCLITKAKLAFIEQIEQSPRSAVSGRLRAILCGNIVYYEYQARDRDVINAFCRELQSIADKEGYKLLFREMD